MLLPPVKKNDPCHSSLQGVLDHFDPGNFSGKVFVEQPHSKINQFNGYV